MNTTYPHHFSEYRETLKAPLPPMCGYCLSFLASAPVSPNERRDLEERHSCIEKIAAKMPAAPVPFH